MIRDDKGNYEAVDFREAAPAAGHENMYQGNVPGSIYGGLAVGVPSEVLGLEYIHKKYGVSCVLVHLTEYLTNSYVVTAVEDSDARCHPRRSSWLQRFVSSTTQSPSTILERFNTDSPDLQVSTDLIRYIERAVHGKRNFLVEDPIWAEDFAPNGP